MYEIYFGDCIKMADKFQPETFNALITDIPYNVSQKTLYGVRNRRIATSLDFGEWDYNFDTTGWLKHYTPLIKKGGALIAFCSFKQISYLAIELENLGFIAKDMLRFIKDNPMPRNRDRVYVKDCEVAIWAVKKGAPWTFHRPADKLFMRPLYQAGITGGKERKEGNHPTQKPLKVMNGIIATHTNEDDLVLDCFMGSGTTGVACLTQGRNFVGIEKEEVYFKNAEKRLSKIVLGAG